MPQCLYKIKIILIIIQILFINNISFSQEDLNFGSFGEDDSVFMNEKPKKKNKKSTHHWGFGLGLTPTSIQVQEGATVRNLKGNNFVVRFSYDRPILQRVNLVLGANYLPISGSQADPQIGTAKFDANFLSLELMGRLNLNVNSMDGLWIGGGLNYFYHVGKASSNVIDSGSVTSLVIPQVSLGYNSLMSPEFLNFRVDGLYHTEKITQNGSVKITQYIISAIYYH